MSNAADILAIDGPMIGTMVCHPLPIPSTVEFPAATASFAYTHIIFNSPTYGKKFHIATQEPEEIDDAYIDSVIYLSDFTPGWDINPMEGAGAPEA